MNTLDKDYSCVVFCNFKVSSGITVPKLVAYQLLALRWESKTTTSSGVDRPKSASAAPLIYAENLQSAAKSRFSSSYRLTLEVQITQPSCLVKRHIYLPHATGFKRDRVLFGLGHLH